MSSELNGKGSLDLLDIFVSNFDVGAIYDMGWYAADQWMFAVSGVVTALAIAIRSVEEKVNMASGKQSNYNNFFVVSILVAVAIGAYHSIVWVILQFFNAVYGLIDTSDSTAQMAKQLDTVLTKLFAKEYEFELSDIPNSAYGLFATMIYAVSFACLVCVILAMRIAHALLVSFCIFWGAVALPMSITTGLKQLTAFRSLAVLALIWPIVDAFIMYLVSGAFGQMLVKAGMQLDNVETWNMGTLTFYLGAYSIINIILIAATISAPFISQALATGSGNVSGMLASFGGAGIAAGMATGSQMMKGMNTGGSWAGKTLKNTASSIGLKFGEGGRISRANSLAQSNFSEPHPNNIYNQGNDTQSNSDSEPQQEENRVRRRSDRSSQQKQQARRGAIINQQRKNRAQS